VSPNSSFGCISSCRRGAEVRHVDLSPSGSPAVGLAYGPIVDPLLDRYPDCVDYVEIPFEQIRHRPSSLAIAEQIPVLLHCSTMSVAGFVPPPLGTLEAIAGIAAQTRTPWIGEHLAFISADPLESDGDSAAPTELTYTACPQLSEETIERVGANLDRLRQHFTIPIILENSPQYFAIPGSTMQMPSFIAEVSRRWNVDLLLDVTHFLITTRNMGLDLLNSAQQLPLERVVEVHLSGMSMQSGRWWDDHAALVPEAAFEFLTAISDRIQPKAVTFEYNWAPELPHRTVLDQLARIRQMLGS